MCSNYQAVADIKRLARFGVQRAETLASFADEVYPVRPGPMVRVKRDGSGERTVDLGLFGLLPFFAKEATYGRRTYNARTETVGQLASFKHAWGRGQRCVIPAERIYEPNYESGKPVRWAIEIPDEPMGVAGIWTDHPTLKDAAGEPLLSFAMLTVNGEGHPVFQRMHAPEDEKRMVVILAPGDYTRWLDCPKEEAANFFRQYTGPLRTYSAPRPPPKRRSPKPKTDLPLL